MDSHLSAELPDIQSTKKKRKPNWSPEETLLLVNIIADKHLIINGRFKPHLTNKDKKDAWHAVANTINGQNPLVSRTVEEVETKWFSVLSKSRKKIASIKAEYNQTGCGGPQATPLDPIDLKVEELLGKNNETVDGVVSIDLDLEMRRVMRNQSQIQSQSQPQQSQPQQQQSQPQQQQSQPQQQQSQPQQQQPQMQSQQYFDDGSVIEYTMLDSEASIDQTQPPLPLVCSTPSRQECTTDSDREKFNAERRRLKLEEQKLKLLKLKKKIELMERLTEAKINYYNSKAKTHH